MAPDFKTIADFRKDNGKAIPEVYRSFVALCRELHLLSEASVAIDGSKFKAVNARDKNFTDAKMKRRLERMDESIGRYMAQLETADRRGDVVPEAKVARLRDKIVRLKEEVARLGMIKVEMMMSENKQISLTDPAARSMASQFCADRRSVIAKPTSRLKFAPIRSPFHTAWAHSDTSRLQIAAVRKNYLP